MPVGERTAAGPDKPAGTAAPRDRHAGGKDFHEFVHPHPVAHETPVPTHPAHAPVAHAGPAHGHPAYGEPAYGHPTYGHPAPAPHAHAEQARGHLAYEHRAYHHPAHFQPAHVQPAHVPPGHIRPGHGEAGHVQAVHPHPPPSHAHPVHAGPAERATRHNEAARAHAAPAGHPPAGGGAGAHQPPADVALRQAMTAEAVPDSWHAGLEFIMMQESGGRVGVRNPASSARGLFQLTAPNYHLNPHGVHSFGNGTEEAEGGIRYIEERYGTVKNAVAHWRYRHTY